MKGRLLFVTLFALILIAFGFYDGEHFNLEEWKKTWQSFSPETREELSESFLKFYNTAPRVIQEALVEDIVDVAAQEVAVPSDLEEAEFVCGGICIGIGVAVAGGLAFLGHEKGKKDGYKAEPIHHYHKDDDMGIFGLLDKFSKAYDWGRDITYGLLADRKNPGRHIYVYEENDEVQETVDDKAFLSWTATWNTFSKKQQEELLSEAQIVFDNMTEEELALAKERMNKLVDYQLDLAAPVHSDSDLAEEVEFVCGGACIAVAIGAGIGIFTGAYNAGKEKTQLHIHHMKK